MRDLGIGVSKRISSLLSRGERQPTPHLPGAWGLWDPFHQRHVRGPVGRGSGLEGEASGRRAPGSNGFEDTLVQPSVHIHTHSLSHSHTRAHSHTCTHAHTNVHMSTCTHLDTLTHTCILTHMHTHAHMCTHAHTYTHVLGHRLQAGPVQTRGSMEAGRLSPDPPAPAEAQPQPTLPPQPQLRHTPHPLCPPGLVELSCLLLSVVLPLSCPLLPTSLLPSYGCERGALSTV